MKGQIFDYPTRWLVDSESKSGDAYVVNLTDPEFMVSGVFNGSCNCAHFTCVLAPRLRHPNNKHIYRCKHIEHSRSQLLDFLIVKLEEADPNILEKDQT